MKNVGGRNRRKRRAKRRRKRAMAEPPVKA